MARGLNGSMKRKRKIFCKFGLSNLGKFSVNLIIVHVHSLKENRVFHISINSVKNKQTKSKLMKGCSFSTAHFSHLLPKTF